MLTALIASFVVNVFLGTIILLMIYRRRPAPPTPTTTASQSDTQLISMLLEDEQRNMTSWLKY